MQNSAYPIQPFLTSIAVGYKNKALIADKVLPRVPVGAQDFKYKTYTLADEFTIPSTMVGRTSQVNEVQFGAAEVNASTSDYGLEAPVPNADIDNANASGNSGFDPQARAAQLVTDLILLDREKRVADLVFAAANYASGNKLDLSSTHEWDDYTNSDPIADVLTAMDGMIVRPNVLVLGRAVYSALIRHPKIIASAFPTGGNAGTGGIATQEALASIFEVDEVVVGEGFLNTSKPGQTPTLSRVWGKYAALINRNNLADTQFGISFGVTAQWGGRIAGAIPDSNMGLRGGVRVRVGESVKELLLANDLGFLFTNAVS